MEINGWQLYYFRTFAAALDALEADVAALAASDPGDYKTHPRTRLLAFVYKAITERVPAMSQFPMVPPFTISGLATARSDIYRFC